MTEGGFSLLFINIYSYLQGRSQVHGARLFSMLCRSNGHELEDRNFHLNMRKSTLQTGFQGIPYSFCCESDWALEPVTQKGCGAFLSGDLQTLSGNGPGQPALGVSLWASDCTRWPQHPVERTRCSRDSRLAAARTAHWPLIFTQIHSILESWISWKRLPTCNTDYAFSSFSP